MVTSMPKRGRSSTINPYVPPYTSGDATTWSPLESKPIKVVDIALMPLEKISPSSAPSNVAIFLATASEFTDDIRA